MLHLHIYFSAGILYNLTEEFRSCALRADASKLCTHLHPHIKNHAADCAGQVPDRPRHVQSALQPSGRK
jgi:hypothetical protein